MPLKVLIVSAPEEEHWAEVVGKPIRQAGYEVSHSGTVPVGDSIVEEALKTLALGGPVVLCATARAVGTRWARRLVNAARLLGGNRIFIVQIEKDAAVDSIALDEKVVAYWRDPGQAIADLITSLQIHYPTLPWPGSGVDAEQRYRNLMLKACNFIDLASLPEAGHHFSQTPELRQLYVPLRLKIRNDAKPFSISDPLSKYRRLVVEGEAGAGKSTLIRWLATSYLLQTKPPYDWYGPTDIPPAENLLPIVVSCRDLHPASAVGTLEEILHQTLRAAELSKEEISSLFVRLWDRLQKGLLLLLFDGLDELTDLQVRVRLARQIEKISIAHEQAPIVVTSRPAGYRELGFRLSPGFEHAVLTELTKTDKDHFAHLWFSLTEPRSDQRELKKDQLIHEIHSTQRIERLTGNPMLLTVTAMTLAKNPFSKLPQRKADLYGEAIRLLLNRRPCAGEPILPNVALPQLEYLAYAMCDRGLQQITENEILMLLESLRNERPNAIWLRSHSSIELLRFLEAHTGILRRAGEPRGLGMTVPVFELPHPTFQEYLAARALANGYFPGASPQQSLADRVGPLAVSERWQEILQLCVACCGEAALGEVLLAILRPQPEEDAATTARSRAILASRCLADEPGVNEETAQEVLRGLARQVSNQDGDALVRTSLDTAILKLAETRWASRLKLALAQEFQRRELAGRWSIGFLFQKMASLQLLYRTSPPQQDPVTFSGWEQEGIARALDVIGSSSGEEMPATQELVARLMEMLEQSPPAAHAAAWALLSLLSSHQATWRPSTQQLDRIASLAEQPDLDPGAAWGLIKLLAS